MHPTLATGLRQRRRDLAYLTVEGAHWFESLALLVIVLVLLPLLALSVGWLAVPRVVGLLYSSADRARTRSGRFRRTAVPLRRTDLTGPFTVKEQAGLAAAPATRRDLVWLLFHIAVAPVCAVLAPGLALGAVLYTLTPAYWWAFAPRAPVTYAFEVTSWPLAFATAGIGLVYGALAWGLIPWMAGRVSAASLALLRPGRSTQLAQRVDALSASRAAALDTHSAELRRIERDLHDGAQNRLVGVVMMLGLARRALENDPAGALPFLDRAQASATEALAGLRAVVHDIYPPVLDELGLEGAAASLTSRCAVPSALRTVGLRRAPAAVESAAYFVVAEALTNVVKHSGAHHVDVVLRTDSTLDEDVLVIEVSDDGRGGASLASRGTGLVGIARRVAAFEGTLTVDSPTGGPTTVKAELPCAY
ncbi:MAG: histidine kinase [Cellulomonas sp.]